MRRGFTLVELSIVLIIIGLLIGGVLVARSMIGTTRTQSFIKQASQFDIAVDNFQVKFNALPGDATSFSGNGNGLITGGFPSDPGDYIDDAYFRDEVGRFWFNLSQSGLRNENGTNYTDNSSGSNGVLPGINAPKSALGAAGSSWIAITPEGNPPNVNFYLVGVWSSSNVDPLQGAVAASLTPAEMLAVDKKIDDGRATPYDTDWQRVWAYGYGLGCFTGTFGNYNYDTTVTSPVCIPVIRIGISSGQLK